MNARYHPMRTELQDHFFVIMVPPHPRNHHNEAPPVTQIRVQGAYADGRMTLDGALSTVDYCRATGNHCKFGTADRHALLSSWLSEQGYSRMRS